MSGVWYRSQRRMGRICARLLLLGLALVAFDPQAATIAAGRFHELWVKDDGSLAAWGYNPSGQVGDGSYIDRSFPVPVPGLAGIKVAPGGVAGGVVPFAGAQDRRHGVGVGRQQRRPDRRRHHVFAHTAGAGRRPDGCRSGLRRRHRGAATTRLPLKADGTVWAWGKNGYGQLGDGTTTGHVVPARVAGLTGVVSIAGGALHSLALRSDGTVWAWGDNSVGELGDGTTTLRAAPVQVAGLTGVVEISTTYYHSVARKSDGTVWTWG